MEACFLHERGDRICGNSRGHENLVKLSSCKDDIQLHLRAFHLSNESIEEFELILQRSGSTEDLWQQFCDDIWICPVHRHALGKYWRPSRNSCHYPAHGAQRKKVTGRDVVSLRMTKEIRNLHGEHVEVGSRKLSKNTQ